MATMDPNALQLASNWVQLLRHCLFCSSSSCIEQQCAAGRRFGHQLVANLAHQDINETHLDPLSRLFVHYVNCRDCCKLCAALPSFSLPGGPLSPLPSPGTALGKFAQDPAARIARAAGHNQNGTDESNTDGSAQTQASAGCCSPGSRQQLSRWMRALLTGFLLSNSPDFRSRKATWLRMIQDPRTRALSQQLLQHRLECEDPFCEICGPALATFCRGKAGAGSQCTAPGAGMPSCSPVASSSSNTEAVALGSAQLLSPTPTAPQQPYVQLCQAPQTAAPAARPLGAVPQRARALVSV